MSDFGKTTIFNGLLGNPPPAIFVTDWLISKKIFSSDTAYPNEP
jgi:hypothetical protein